jgi:hypothetical protein
MKRIIAAIGLVLFPAGGASADHHSCNGTTCPVEVLIASVAEDKVYGLLIGAPKVECARVRYRVETVGLRLLGKTPALAAGEVAVVRIGNGYAPGAHVLLVSAEGCATAPHLSRQVTLRKVSPDHGWRATLVGAAQKPWR